jgi:U3 small nucleolar RNA-associated protein 18
MGTVNIYSIEGGKIQEKPVKTIMSLTTAITDLKFGPTGQTLAFCSKWKKNSVRMVHIPSY